MPYDLAVLSDSTVPALIAEDLDLARTLVREELAASTRAGYTRDLRLFAAWCVAREVCPMPASPAVVAAYVAHLVREGRVRAGTLSRRMAAVSWAHRLANEPDPTKETDQLRDRL